METFTDKRIADLIGLIYEASYRRSADAWASVCRRIAETVSTGSEQLSIRVVDEERPELAAIIEHSPNVADRDSADEPMDGPGSGEVRVVVRPADDQEGLPENPAQRTRAGFACRIKVREPDLIGEVSVTAQAPVEGFESDGRLLIETIAPHILRAFKIHLGFAEIETERRAISESLEGVSQGVVALDRDGRTIYLNGLARRIIDGGDCLTLDRNGRLRAVSKIDDEKLRTFLAAVGSVESEPAQGYRGAIRISRANGRRPISVVIGSFSLTDPVIPGSGTVTLLFVNDPERRFDGLETVLSEIYSLTPAEARLTVLLARGDTLRQACEELGVTENTARTHLKRVFSKTETDRQSELVRIVQNYCGSVALHGNRR